MEHGDNTSPVFKAHWLDVQRTVLISSSWLHKKAPKPSFLLLFSKVLTLRSPEQSEGRKCELREI